MRCNFIPNLGSLVRNIFIDSSFGQNMYVGPFWTIKYEFLGYIAILVYCSIAKNNAWRRLGAVIVGICVGMIFDVQLIPFFGGFLLADILYIDNRTIFCSIYEKALNNRYVCITIGIIGLFFTSCPMYFSGIYEFFNRIPKMSPFLVRCIGMVLMLFFIMKNQVIQRVFSWKPLVWLGKMSFSIYGFHWPVMMTLQVFLFMKFIDIFSYNVASVFSFVLILPVVVLLSIISFKYVEGVFGVFLNRIVKLLIERTEWFIPYYNNDRKKEGLNHMTPVEYRRANPKGIYLMVIKDNL